MYRPDQPNPYGSFFDPAFITSAMAGIPHMNPGFGADISNVMGHGSGGLMPTAGNYAMTMLQNQNNLGFVREANEKDSRARAVVDYLAKAGASKTIAGLGGAQQVSHLLGNAINMPGVAGFLGGQQGSLAVGALALAGSGTRIMGDPSFGIASAQRAAARRIFDDVNQSFFGGGANNLRMTSGLNRDQIGGIMAMGAAQGAFGGLELGKLEQQPKGLGFKMDESARRRITEFTKQAAKTMASLVDVFGDRSIGELSDIMYKITGLDMSRMENVQKAGEKIKSLKQTAAAVGVDTRTAFDLAAKGTSLGVALGLDTRVAGAFSSQYAGEAMQYSRINQGRRANNWFYNDPSMSERQQMSMRDASAMLRDPRGERMAMLALMQQSGTISAEDAAGWTERLKGAGIGGVTAIDQELHSKYGKSMTTMIRNRGGGQAIAAMLKDPEGLKGSIDDTMDRNVERRIRAALSRENLDKQKVDSLWNLSSSLSKDILSGAASAVDRGDMSGLDKILKGDAYASKNAGLYKSQLLSLGQGNALGLVKEAGQLLEADPWGKNFTDKSTREAAKLQRMKFAGWDTDDTARLSGFANTMSQGFFDALSNNDPSAVIASMMKYRPGTVFGDLKDPSKQLFLEAGNYKLSPSGIADRDSISKFKSTWAAMPKEARDALFREQALPFGDIITKHGGKYAGDVNFTGAMADQDYGTLIKGLNQVWGDPELREKYFSKYQSAGLSTGGSLLIDRKTSEDLMHNRDFKMGATLEQVVGMNKKMQGAEQWSKYANALMTGYYTDKDGRRIPLTEMDRTKYEQFLTSRSYGVLNSDNLLKMTDAQRQYLGRNADLAGFAINNLQQDINDIDIRDAETPGEMAKADEKQKKRLQVAIDQISQFKPEQMADKLEGTLRLLDATGTTELGKVLLEATKKVK